jgi:hypothetical protein
MPVSFLAYFPPGLAQERVMSWLAFSLGEMAPWDSGYHCFASGGILMG